MPWEMEDGKALLWRREAAELAVAVAREIQAQSAEGTCLPDDIERSVYETALLAVADMPDEVAVLALELSRRRNVLPAIRARTEEAGRKAKAANLRAAEGQPCSRRATQELPAVHPLPGAASGPLA